jgi:hypothetical protein
MSTSTIDRTAVVTTSDTARRWPITGALLIIAAVLAAAGAAWLSSVFDWPDVLDAPGSVALPSFLASESAVRTAFYLLLVSSLLLIPVAIYLEQLVGGPARPGVRVVTAFGVLGGFAQILGWVRWPVTVPHLADAYATSDESTRSAISASYDVLNRYAGGALGEHMGAVPPVAAHAVGIGTRRGRVACAGWEHYLGRLVSVAARAGRPCHGSKGWTSANSNASLTKPPAHASPRAPAGIHPAGALRLVIRCERPCAKRP